MSLTNPLPLKSRARQGLFETPIPAVLLAVLLAAVLLAMGGCAAEQAYSEGQALMASGQPVAALGKLEEANRLEPGSAEYRAGLLRAREQLIQQALNRADQALKAKKWDEADGAYRALLTQSQAQDRALEGLRQVERLRGRDAQLARVQNEIDQADWVAARADLVQLRQESPHDTELALLAQQIDQRTAEQERKSRSAGRLAAAYRQPINLEFRDAPLQTIFEVISRTAGLNFLFDKEVRVDQRASIYLRNSTVEAAVNWLLLTNQLEGRELDANTMLIYPAISTKQQEYQPMVVKSFYLANADAKRVGETLRTLLKSRNVVVDESLNMVILRDSPEAVRLAEKLVALHDVPAPEVMLDVEILEVKRGRLLDLGVAWPEQLGFAPLSSSSSSSGAITLNDLRNLNRSTIGVTGASASVSATAQDSDTNLLANPRIRVRNREKAKILIGDRVPTITTNVTSTGVSTESINYLDVGLKLDVEPTIYVDNEVAINIGLEVSSITKQQQTQSGALIYQIGARTAQTTLRLKDGENQILAGLINDEDRKTAKKLPGMGDLPLVGRLFGEQSKDHTKTEIVLSITPHILRNIRRPGAQEQEFDSGTENRLRPWPSNAGASNAAAANTPAGPSTGTSAGTSSGISTQAGAGGLPPGAGAALDKPIEAVPPEPPKLRLVWSGPAKVKAGEDFKVQLSLEGEHVPAEMPLVLEFDPSVLQPYLVSAADEFKALGSGAELTSRIDGSGQVSLQVKWPKEGSAQAGPLAVLSLRARQASAVMGSQLVVVKAAPVDSQGQALSVARPAPLSLQVQ